MKRFYLFLVLAVVLLSSSQSASACRCSDPLPPFSAYLHASAVFVGKVVAIYEQDHKKEVVFEVTQNLKSIFKTKISLHTGHNSCDWKFVLHSTYLVYADKDKDGNLTAQVCSRTKLYSEAEAELKELHGHEDMDCKVPMAVESSEVCPEQYEPVCGCDKKTYGNACIAHNNGINHWTWGACPKVQPQPAKQ